MPFIGVSQEHENNDESEKTINIGLISNFSTAPIGIHFAISQKDFTWIYLESKISSKFLTRQFATEAGTDFGDLFDFSDIILNIGIQTKVSSEISLLTGGGVNMGPLYTMGYHQNESEYLWSYYDKIIVFPNLNLGLKFEIKHLFIIMSYDVSFISQDEYYLGYPEVGWSKLYLKNGVNFGIGLIF